MTVVSTAGSEAIPGVTSDDSTPLIAVKHLLIFGVLLAAWELAARTGLAHPLLFPAPSAIAVSIWRIYVTQGNVWYHLYVTFAEALAGCFVGVVIGILLATSAALSET